MHKELRYEFVEPSVLIVSSSVLDYAPKISTRIENSYIQVNFSAACLGGLQPGSNTSLAINWAPPQVGQGSIVAQVRIPPEIGWVPSLKSGRYVP